MLNKILFLILTISSLTFANLAQQKTQIQNVSSNNATISIGNLTIGQTGVIIHQFDDTKSIIIADFEVTSTSLNDSKISFKYSDFENKVAIPTPNISVKNGDTAILNHMYNTSLIIAPDFESFDLINKNFSKQNFIHSDIFGAYLKSENKPAPTKKEFSAFCKKNNIGTVYFFVDGFVYVVDSKTFTILEEYKIKKEINQSTFMTPFYTNIEDIKSGLFSFGDNTIANYNKHYSQLLGL